MTDEKKTVLITGASGLLGRALVKKFNEFNWKVEGTALTRAHNNLHKIDLTNRDEIDSLLNKIKPDFIVHSAAQRIPAAVENDFEKAWSLNVAATQYLGEKAASLHIPMIYISTDYVFDGQSKESYKETDSPNPVNKYGKTKLEGENALLSSYPESIVLRISVLYGDVETLSESAVTCLLQNLLEPSKERYVSDLEIRWPSHVDDVALICIQLAEKKLQDPSLNGIFHWSGKEGMTKYNMVQKMAEVFNLPMDHINPDKTPSLDVTRPLNCQLQSTKLEALGIGYHTPFTQGIIGCLQNFIVNK